MGRILTTGTEPSILDTIRFVAMVRGAHEVSIAQNSHEMLQHARRNRPNLAIWDLGYDERTTNQYLARWNEDSTLRSIPMVLLTNGGDIGHPKFSTPLPTGTTTLEKPVDLVELGLHVGALLDPDHNVNGTPLTDHRRQVGKLRIEN